MQEDEAEKQAEFAVWVNKAERIVTFQEKEGYEKHILQSMDKKMSYVYNLCESGYRIL